VARPSASRELFRGRWLRVVEEEWPGVGTWEIVRPSDAATVVPHTPDGDVLLVRQFRPAVGRAMLEIPAGHLDVEGEAPAECAARELREETGFRPVSIEPLGVMFPSPGAWGERIHLFLAETAPEPEADPEEGIELVRRPFDEIVADARAGRVDDAKTALALLLSASRRAGG
jgi:ADP-ribose pyrophosphatase